jgi:hypothetical protein
MASGINQSVELRVLGANSTDSSCGNYVGGRLDAVTGIKFQPSWAGAHLLNLVKRSTISAGLLLFSTPKIHRIVSGYFGYAKDFTVTRQTSEIFFTMDGLFQCYFANFVFFFRHIVTREAGDPYEVLHYSR